MRAMTAAWLQLGFDSWRLGMESASVIGLRAMKLAAGNDAAAREAQLMVNEKIAAANDLNLALLTGRFGGDPVSVGHGVVRHYGRRVRANRRRLTGR